MTSNPPYSCCISGCSETRVFTSYVSHILSHKLSEFSEATRKNIAGGVKGELVVLCPPKISKVPNHKIYKCCFGCKKMYARPILQDEHKRECKNKDAHKEACKKLLETASTTQEAEPQATPLLASPQADEALKKEYDRLQTKCTAYQEQIEEADAKAEKADKILDGLKMVLKYVKGKDWEIYDTLCDEFKEEHPDLLAFVKL